MIKKTMHSQMSKRFCFKKDLVLKLLAKRDVDTKKDGNIIKLICFIDNI